MEWTEKQKHIIEELRGKNLLVSAAAGAGKTTILVERIINLLLEDEVNIDQMLIVTFTRAAAAEMKEKIQQVLEKRLALLSKAPHIREQLDRLSKAQISTNHAFALEIVRRNYHLLDIDPAFRIGDNTETEILKEEALEEVMDKYYQQGEDAFFKLVKSYSSSRGDGGLRDMFFELYHFIQSKPYPFKWLEEAVAMYSPVSGNYEQGLWVEELRSRIRSILYAGKEQLNRALKLCRYQSGPREYAENIETELSDLNDLFQALETGLESFYDRLLTIEFSRLKSIRGQRKEEVDDVLQSEVRRLRDDYRDEIKKIKGAVVPGQMSEYFSRLREIYPLVEIMATVVRDFSERYLQLKQERNILDFSDIEHYALQILENEEAANELKEKYKYIFVDEYQDSNAVQEMIINRIRRKDNLFLVGDVKQSIYRFRLAEPTLFIEKYNKYSPDYSHQEVRIDLEQNFRSRKELLRGINFLFSNLMSRELGELDYDKNARLVCGLDFAGEAAEPPLELNVLDYNNNEIEDETLADLGRIEMEAYFAACRIKELLGQTVYDPRQKKEKELEYSDIVILLRSPAGRIETYQEVFLEQNIPLYADSNLGFLETVEIKVFINLLKILDNQKQDLPLLSVLRSMIGDFSVAELARIRAEAGQGSFNTALVEYGREQNDVLSEKINHFLQRLRDWREESRYLKMDEFIWKLLIDTGYYHFSGSLPGGKRRQANLRVLVDRAREFENNAGSGIFSYIRYIDKVAKSSGDLGTARVIGENENVVRLMSVHKSKGLEFPVVLLGDLGKRFNLKDLYRKLLLHRELGIGLDYVDFDSRIRHRSLSRVAIRERKRREHLSEELRILYVALTRAMNRLILFGSTRYLSSESQKWLGGIKSHQLLKGNSYLDWIGKILIRHPRGEILRKLAGIGEDDLDIIDDNSEWKINYYQLQDLKQYFAEEVINRDKMQDKLLSLHSMPDSSIGKDIRRRLNWKYPQQQAVELPSKMAVTAIQRARAEGLKDTVYNIPPLIKKPSFTETESDFSGAERGSIIHFVLQHLKLGATEVREIENQLQDMIERELLSREEVEVVEAEKIADFFTSELGERLLTAEEVFREVPFVLKKKADEIFPEMEGVQEEILVQGIIDCYFKEQGKLVLIDYKTDRLPAGRTEPIKERYREQLSIYQEALSRIKRQQVGESYIYLFNVGQALRMD